MTQPQCAVAVERAEGAKRLGRHDLAAQNCANVGQLLLERRRRRRPGARRRRAAAAAAAGAPPGSASGCGCTGARRAPTARRRPATGRAGAQPRPGCARRVRAAAGSGREVAGHAAAARRGLLAADCRSASRSGCSCSCCCRCCCRGSCCQTLRASRAIRSCAAPTRRIRRRASAPTRQFGAERSADSAKTAKTSRRKLPPISRQHVDALFAKVVAPPRSADPPSSPISPASSTSHSLKARDTRTAPLRNSAARRALRRSRLLLRCNGGCSTCVMVMLSTSIRRGTAQASGKEPEVNSACWARCDPRGS